MIINQVLTRSDEPNPDTGFYAVDISINEPDPELRVAYPKSITVNGIRVLNTCWKYTPMRGSSSGVFTTGSWSGSSLLSGIKPVSFNGTTWTDMGTDASQWSNNSAGTDYFTEFPFWWLSITNNGTKIRIIFSNADTQPDSTFQCYAHAKACDSYSNDDIIGAVSSASRTTILSSNNNNYFANAFHVGCFAATGDTSGIYSQKGNIRATNATALVSFFKGANTRGNEYDCLSMQQWMYIQALFVLLFKSTDSRSTHSDGLIGQGTSTSNIGINAGLSTNTYGMAGTVGTAVRNSFLWLHDIYGNLMYFVGGMWCTYKYTNLGNLVQWLPRQSNDRAFTNGLSNTSSASSQANIGTVIDEAPKMSGFTSAVKGDNDKGFVMSANEGTSSTYYCDSSSLTTGGSNAVFPYVGGRYDSGASSVGIFSIVFYSESKGAYRGASSRLAYRGGHS